MALNESTILEKLHPIHDPDLHRSIVDLGFVKNIKIGGGNVSMDLELTTPACPVKDQLKQACIDAIQSIPGVGHVSVNLTSRTRAPQMETRQILTTVKNIIAVASGKGGVAKSTTAVNLAAALAESGAKVGVLDADIYGPSVPTMMAIDRPPQPLPDNRIVPAVSNGVQLISMAFFMPKERAAILRGPMVSGYVNQFLSNVVWGDLDYLIIDYPPGTGDIQLTLSQRAPITGAVIVTTPQDVALSDVRRAIAMFRTTNVPVLGVCETMSYYVVNGEPHYIFGKGGGERIAKETGVPFLGAIPIDPNVSEGGDKGLPVVSGYPSSPAAIAYKEVAGRVAREISTLNVQGGEALEAFTLEWNR
jgi:ATP-binding protein involved in chromosome partitioning